jgi:tRNA (mo5U34)-methyltransferase
MATATVTKEQVDKIFWWHTIDLGNGVKTPGGTDTYRKVKEIGLPRDLTGKTVLDIGAWDGFFSFESERRGASRVVALDHVVWNDPTVGKHGFELARGALESKVEDVDCDVYDITPERIGTFDLVLFLGVLYHVQDPLYVLQNVASVTREHMILETHVDLCESNRPIMAYYEGNECANGLSNWCGPNAACLEAMLKTVGFRKVQLYWSHLDSWRKPVGYKIRGNSKSKFGRMVYHAWK